MLLNLFEDRVNFGVTWKLLYQHTLSKLFDKETEIFSFLIFLVDKLPKKHIVRSILNY